MSYTITHQKSGISYQSKAKTIAGAKREATADATFGGGSVTVHGKEGTTSREFWQELSRYGWEKWSQLR